VWLWVGVEGKEGACVWEGVLRRAWEVVLAHHSSDRAAFRETVGSAAISCGRYNQRKVNL